MITSCRREPAIFLLGPCAALLPAHADHVRGPNVSGMDFESPGLRTSSRSWIWSSCPGRAILSVSARLTHIRAITGSQLRRTMERVDDVDQAASFIGSATPRRSTQTLAVTRVAAHCPDRDPVCVHTNWHDGRRGAHSPRLGTAPSTRANPIWHVRNANAFSSPLQRTSVVAGEISHDLSRQVVRRCLSHYDDWRRDFLANA
jgi:hypothetical protein